MGHHWPRVVRRTTNGQAERMNRTIKDPAVKTFHDDSLAGLKAPVLAFAIAYNLAGHRTTGGPSRS